MLWPVEFGNLRNSATTYEGQFYEYPELLKFSLKCRKISYKIKSIFSLSQIPKLEHNNFYLVPSIFKRSILKVFRAYTIIFASQKVNTTAFYECILGELLCYTVLFVQFLKYTVNFLAIIWNFRGICISCKYFLYFIVSSVTIKYKFIFINICRLEQRHKQCH